MARLSFTPLLLLSLALLSAPAFAADRKLLQQINAPITVQCVNLLDNNQIANIPNLNAGVVQLILNLAGFGGGQTPSAVFWNSGTSENHCSNNQEFKDESQCGSFVGPINAPILGWGSVAPCYGAGGNRKLLQQVNAPVTAQCLNVLDNNQILNVPNADVQVIGAIVSALSLGGAQSPAAWFLSYGSAENHCTNWQDFSNYASCGSVVGPINLPVGGVGWVTPCYGAAGHKRKMLQQVNAPITVQCINILDNNQIANIPNLNVGVVQLIVNLLGLQGGQTPSAVFWNSGTSTNNCQNNQEFKDQSRCSSFVGPLNVPVLGYGLLAPCYN